ncbi:MAG: hypothetical protein CMA97_01365, partial [Euryarchaeota archaeon]|nr:hypothetical protein [Euryarchaeota archaeon]
MVENKEGPLEALCILFSDTKGIQWAAANATLANPLMANRFTQFLEDSSSSFWQEWPQSCAMLHV